VSHIWRRTDRGPVVAGRLADPRTGRAFLNDGPRQAARRTRSGLARSGRPQAAPRLVLLNVAPGASFSAQRWQASPRAGGIPVHLHRATEEAFYVVEGALGLWLDDRADVRAAGSYVHVRPGVPHSFWNPGQRPATYITVMAPGGFERYLADLATGLRDATDEHQAATLRERLAQAHDITVLGPPPPIIR